VSPFFRGRKEDIAVFPEPSRAGRFAAFLFIYEVEIIHCSRTTKSVATKL
jgi:hypothetical protein